MTIHPLAGQPPSPDMLIDVTKLEHEYYERATGIQRPESAGTFRHQRASGNVCQRHLHGVAHSGDHAGRVRLPSEPRN